MTELARLRDAVVQAARRLANIPGIELQAEGSEEAFSALDDALAALDAHPAQRATAETVRVAVWKYDDGGYLFTEPGSKEAIWLAQRGNVTRLGTTTLRLDTEVEG